MTDSAPANGPASNTKKAPRDLPRGAFHVAD